MNSPVPKPGDILRATHFAVFASAEQPLWLLCTDDADGWHEGVSICGGTQDAHPPEDSWEIVPDTDEYEIVPLDELPDEVCVALAMRALIEGGED